MSIKYQLNNTMPQGEITGECHKVCRKLYSDCLDKKITLNEFRKEIAYVSLEYILDELEYRPLHAIMPDCLKAYYSQDKDSREAKKSFWERDDVKAYIEARDKHDCEMLSNFRWLTVIKKRFAKLGDTSNAFVCSKLMKMYPAKYHSHMESQRRGCDEKKDTVKKKESIQVYGEEANVSV